MKRSEINDIGRAARAFIKQFQFALPPFAHWSVEDMRSDAAADIRQKGLGWDVTDYGQGKFDELGLFLFTLRNGNVADLNMGRGMLYAEKLLISRDRQLSPMHRHMLKAEDIINRGGADLIMELFPAHPDGSINRDAGVTVPSDGREIELGKGELLRLRPGESVTLMPGVWHAFWAEKGDCLIGEVSTVNDDKTDNWFEDALPRFTKITEDAAADFLMVSDYA